MVFIRPIICYISTFYICCNVRQKYTLFML